MDIKKTVRRLKPYKNMLLISLLLSGVIGISLFLLKKDKSMIFVGSLLPMLSSLFQILFLEREFASLITFTLILLSLIYYSSFNFFKKALIAITNFNKERGASYNVFIILLVLGTLISIITTQYSLVVKYRIDKKEAQRGNQGRVGERGDIGAKAENLTSESDIINQTMDQYSENILKIAIEQRFPDKYIDHSKTYFNNILMKQSIDNAINSWGFRSMLIDLRQRYLNDLPTKQQNNPDKPQCELEEIDFNNMIKALQHMMQLEINAWFEIFSLYENGLTFLQQPLLLETSWETLYSKRDKENNLPKTPFELLEKRDIWLWNSLTKKEYFKNTHKLSVKCDSLNNDCNPIRTLNDQVLHYPIIYKNEFGIHQIKMIELTTDNE